MNFASKGTHTYVRPFFSIFRNFCTSHLLSKPLSSGSKAVAVSSFCIGRAHAFDNTIPELGFGGQLLRVAILRSTAGKCLGYVMVHLFLQIRCTYGLTTHLFHSPSRNHAQCGWPWSIYHLVSIIAIASTLTTPACDPWLCERWHVQRGFVSS